MPTAARRESSTYSSTDNNTDNRLSDTDKPWDGGSAHQATWFNQKLKSAECDFEFHQLCTSTTVTLKKNGTIAVFSPEHAVEHAQGANKGTMRAPNNRKREDLLARSLAKAASSTTTSSPSPSSGHGAVSYTHLTLPTKA